MNARSPDMPDENTLAQESVQTGSTRLQRLRWPLMLLGAVVVVGAGAYFYFTSGRYQNTNDAYTRAATVSISANVAGRVSEVNVRDNEVVQRGSVLFRIDDAPFRIAVDDAAARLASARLQIASLKSTYRQRLVELRAARDSQAYQQQQYDRQTRLLASPVRSRILRPHAGAPGGDAATAPRTARSFRGSRRGWLLTGSRAPGPMPTSRALPAAGTARFHAGDALSGSRLIRSPRAACIPCARARS